MNKLKILVTTIFIASSMLIGGCASLDNSQVTKKTIASKKKYVASKNKSVANKKKSVASKKKSIASKKKSIASKKKSVASKKKSVASKNKSVASKKKSIASKNKSVASKKKSIANKNKSVASKKKTSGYTYSVRGKTYKTLGSSKNYNKTGSASWYGNPFHGRKTANGEIYDMYQLTAAHKSLPLGSKVKVTNLSNKRSVVLRVNDRGPFHGNRIIDVSYAAAKKLGFVHSGVSRVVVTAVQ